MTHNPDLTLVCGGGGVWGVAWMTGLANELANEGIDLRDAATFIGTSAGSVVSTQFVTAGTQGTADDAPARPRPAVCCFC